MAMLCRIPTGRELLLCRQADLASQAAQSCEVDCSCAAELTIDGYVDRPQTLTYADLRRLPAVSVVAFLECMGNSRGRFAQCGQPTEGIQWGDGIAHVEVSANGGATWHAAQLLDDLGPRSWRPFAWSWDAAPGIHLLAARATDLAGHTQPVSVPFNQKGYLMNAIQHVPIRVV